MRFLFAWQHVAAPAQLTGVDGLRAVIGQLDGYEIAADAWERAVLPARVEGYEPSMLDHLCLTGEVAWARLSAPAGDLTHLIGATPIALFLREHADRWVALRPASGELHPDIAGDSRQVLEVLRTRGASFAHDLSSATGLDSTAVRAALGTLVAAGLVASDGFGGLRTIVRAATGRRVEPAARSTVAGRWSLIHPIGTPDHDSAVETQARALLARYGVVFRKLLAREANGSPWRELTRVYRRLEARGEIRGGRFVAGMSGEQFALSDAVERLREVRRTAPDGRVVAISAADPLNLAGIVTTGERVRGVAANRVAYRNGVAVAALEGEYIRPLTQIDEGPSIASEVASTLTGRELPAITSGFVGR
jgi:ATP-dependent Lhr-like helicase